MGDGLVDKVFADWVVVVEEQFLPAALPRLLVRVVEDWRFATVWEDVPRVRLNVLKAGWLCERLGLVVDDVLVPEPEPEPEIVGEGSGGAGNVGE